MNPESFNSPTAEDFKKDRMVVGGRVFEKVIGEPVHCEWDGLRYVELLKQHESKAAQALLDDWAEKHIMQRKDWVQLQKHEVKNRILWWVEKHQPKDWNPKDPPILQLVVGEKKYPNSYPSDIHAATAEALGLEDYSELELFTAVDTPADTMYGYDMFFKYKGVRFTLDPTTDRRGKERKTEFQDKADYIISWEMFDEKRNFVKPTTSELADEARKIAKYFKLKIESQQISRKNLVA